MSQAGIFLSSLYRNETITLIIEEAINGRYPITFIIHKSGMTCKSGEERKLSKGDLSAIRYAGFDEKAQIEIEPHSIERGQGAQLYRRGQDQDVGYCGLRADDITLGQIKKQFGEGDKGLKIDGFYITPLTPKEIEDRTREISNYSLEQRAEPIKQRGFQIYTELKDQYPDITFSKKYIAQLIQKEEKPIYQSLKKAVPPVSSYLKHTRKPVSVR